MKRQKTIKRIFCIILLCCIGIIAAYGYTQNRADNTGQTVNEVKNVSEEMETAQQDPVVENDDRMEEESLGQEGKPDTEPGFIPIGGEWVENNVGITVLHSEHTLHPAELADDIYRNPDYWQLGQIADTLDDPEHPREFYFVTVQITNYSNEATEVWELLPNYFIRQYTLFGLEENGTYVKNSGSICFSTRNMGNSGEALHTFGNFELSPRETVEVTYGYDVFLHDEPLDWYLTDHRIGLEMDIKGQKVYLMCIEEGQSIPDVEE